MRFMQAVRLRVIMVGVVSGTFATAALGQTNEFETPPSFAARQVLPPILQQSPYHTIVDPVQNDGFLNIYRMRTKSGDHSVVGTDLLKIRVREAEAAAKLADVSASGQMLKSAGRTATKPLKTGKDLVTKPGATVKRTFRGVGRFFGRVGAGLDATDPQREGTIASITGASETKRQLAYKFGVDPYTQFAPLSEQLSRLASAGALGGTATGVGLAFVSGGAGVAISVGSTSENLRALLRDKSAAELEKIGRNQLASMAVPAAAINAFYRNQFMTPTDKAVIVSALKSLGDIENQAAFVARAAQAVSLPRAFALRRRAELAATYHAKVSRINSFVNLGGVPMMRTAKGIIAIFPVDYLPWTQHLSEMARSVNRDKGKVAGAAPVEIWIKGRASKRTATNFKKLGWSLVEDAEARLGG